ncbi:MAG: hypothetical protein AAF266_13645 [Planctomycetota bacterium]
MTIELPDKTAAELRAMLKRNGDPSSLEDYVQRTLAKRLLFDAAVEARLVTRDADQHQLDAEIDEAIRASKKSEG